MFISALHSRSTVDHEVKRESVNHLSVRGVSVITRAGLPDMMSYTKISPEVLTTELTVAFTHTKTLAVYPL